MRTSPASNDGYSASPLSQAFNVLGDLGTVRSGIREGKANPLSGVVPDDVYVMLRSNDLINEKALRDYVIRQMFLRLKEEAKLRTAEAITALVDMYPYLQYDTIRKIVYRVYPTSTRKGMI
jgi:hypothetical protein